MTIEAPTKSMTALLAGLIDYAGLFPPAALTMEDASEEFNRRRLSPEAPALNAFVCPASRLEELTEAARVLMPGTYATSGYREMAMPGMADPWPLSVVIDTDLHDAIDAIDAFNRRHAEEEGGLAVAQSVELPMPTPGEVDEALEIIPEDLRPFFEIPPEAVLAGEDPRGYVAALAGNDGCAGKIRCGGVKPEAIPEPEQLARFIIACHQARVPFKATAGLHHPFRAEHPLTYDQAPPRAVMHGFVNVFTASALVHTGQADEARCTEILSETDPAAFVFSDEGVGWKDLTVRADALATARERFALGYGSCSFSEPLDDLRAMKLL